MYMDGVRKGQVFLSNRACNYNRKMGKNYFQIVETEYC
jgi:hypothetical protein